MKYHLTITDNDTGKIIENADCCCVIGAYANETIATEFYVMNGDAIPIIATAYAALKTIERMAAVHPELAHLLDVALKKGGIFEDE